MPDCLALNIPQQVYVAGGSVSGAVELNFLYIQDQQVEEVHVKLRGSVSTWVRKGRSSEVQNIPLVRENLLLWTHGSAYPSPGSHSLRVPFQFNLPRNLPPSFEFSTTRGYVRYSLEAVAVRSGVFHMNRRILCPLAVVSYDSHGSQIRDMMRYGWCGKSTTVVARNQIRKGMWGDPCNVQIEFAHPAVDAFPLFLPISFTVSIVTVSKILNKDESLTNVDYIWPNPPKDPKEVTFELKRNVHITADGAYQYATQKVPLSGGLDGSRYVDVEVADKEWIPSAGDSSRGQWRQKVTFSSTFVLRCPPTFRSTTITNEYYMHLQAYFGSPFNSVKANVPLVITSGMVPSTSLEFFDPTAIAVSTSSLLPIPSVSSARQHADYTLPPPELDLPPSYWSTTNWGDSKD